MPALAQESPLAADLVVLNAKVWTVNKKQPEAEALAVLKDRIVFVGSAKQARSLIGANTRVLDLAGKRVVPGSGCTTTRSSATSRLNRDDFPTFGLPTMANRASSST